MPTRRHVLELLAAAPVLASCGGADSPDPAAAWRDPGAGETDPRRFALAHAILAPNPHNTQPWLVELDDANGMTLFCDLDRRLAATDPLDRQITLGCGAFLELYRLAAAEQGRFAEIIPFPDGEPSPRLDARPVAHVRFSPIANAARDPLFEQITARRTNRNVCDTTRVPDEAVLAEIVSAAAMAGNFGVIDVMVDPTQVAALRDLVWRAFDREMRTAAAAEETFTWLRFGRDEIARHRDGLAIDGPMIPLFKALGMLNHDAMVDPDSTSNKQAAQDWRRKAETCPAFMSLVTPDDGPTTRLMAGRAYARMNLAASAAGLAMHPWSQALQEYPEMAALYAEMKDKLSVGDGTAQMLVRVGYAAPVGPSARRGVEAILRG